MSKVFQKTFENPQTNESIVSVSDYYSDFEIFRPKNKLKYQFHVETDTNSLVNADGKYFVFLEDSDTADINTNTLHKKLKKKKE